MKIDNRFSAFVFVAMFSMALIIGYKVYTGLIEEPAINAADTTEHVPKEHKKFLKAAEYELEIYKETENYVIVFTDGQLSTKQLLHIARDLRVRLESRNIYFNEYGYYERGDEYASIVGKTLFDFRIKDTEKAIIPL